MKNQYVIKYYKHPIRTRTIMVIVPEHKLAGTLRDIFAKGGYNVRIDLHRECRGKRAQIYIDEFFDWTNEFLKG